MSLKKQVIRWLYYVENQGYYLLAKGRHFDHSQKKKEKEKGWEALIKHWIYNDTQKTIATNTSFASLYIVYQFHTLKVNNWRGNILSWSASFVKIFTLNIALLIRKKLFLQQSNSQVESIMFLKSPFYNIQWNKYKKWFIQ